MAAAAETATTAAVTVTAKAEDMVDNMGPCSKDLYGGSLDELQKQQDFTIMDNVEWGPGIKDDDYDSDQDLAPRPKKVYQENCGCTVPEQEEDKRIRSYIQEAKRGFKREQRRIDQEKKRAARKAAREAKEAAKAKEAAAKAKEAAEAKANADSEAKSTSPEASRQPKRKPETGRGKELHG